MLACFFFGLRNYSKASEVTQNAYHFLSRDSASSFERKSLAFLAKPGKNRDNIAFSQQSHCF
jgi:hypothetical protein